MKTPKLQFKVLGADLQPINGGRGAVYKGLGRWTRKVRDVKRCVQGYHLCPADAVLDWVKPGCRIFIAEGRGDGIVGQDKSVYESVRLLMEVSTGMVEYILSIDAGALSQQTIDQCGGGYRSVIVGAILTEWARRYKHPIRAARDRP